MCAYSKNCRNSRDCLTGKAPMTSKSSRPSVRMDAGEVKKLIEQYKRVAESYSPTRGTQMLRLSTEIHERVAALTKRESQDDD